MENNAKNIIDLLEGVQKAMEVVNEKITTDVESKMSEQELALLNEARKATSKSELKKMADKLNNLNDKMKNYAT